MGTAAEGTWAKMLRDDEGKAKMKGFVILVRNCCVLSPARGKLPETWSSDMRIGAISINSVLDILLNVLLAYMYMYSSSVGVRRVGTFLYISTLGDEM